MEQSFGSEMSNNLLYFLPKHSFSIKLLTKISLSSPPQVYFFCVPHKPAPSIPHKLTFHRTFHQFEPFSSTHIYIFLGQSTHHLLNTPPLYFALKTRPSRPIDFPLHSIVSTTLLKVTMYFTSKLSFSLYVHKLYLII